MGYDQFSANATGDQANQDSPDSDAKRDGPRVETVLVEMPQQKSTIQQENSCVIVWGRQRPGQDQTSETLLADTRSDLCC